jgi:hypothetical protein
VLVGTTLLLFDELHAELERLRYLLARPEALDVLARGDVARMASSAAAATEALAAEADELQRRLHEAYLAAQRAPRANGHP